MSELSIYPNAIDGYAQLPLAIDMVTRVDASSVNRLRCAIINLENELGVLPSGAYVTVRSRLDALEDGEAVGLAQILSRLAILEADVLSLETELGSNPSGIFVTVEERLDAIEATFIVPLTLITDDILVLGSLLIINSSGNLQLADSDTGITDEARVIGSSTDAFLIGEEVEVNAVPGRLIPVLFAAAPAAGLNGSPVYLSSTPGFASTSAPIGAGNVVYLLGILQGADGISTTPDILFQPSLIAVL
jgi:hypothetical protein